MSVEVVSIISSGVVAIVVGIGAPIVTAQFAKGAAERAARQAEEAADRAAEQAKDAAGRAAQVSREAADRAAREARETADRAARDGRLDELRQVIDDAARALMDAMRNMPTPKELPEDPTDQEFVDRMAQTKVDLLQIWAAEARVAARIGTADEIYNKLTDASRVIGYLASCYRDWADDPTEAHLSDAAAIFIDELPPALGQFFDATAKRIGPDRVTPDPPQITSETP